MAFFSDIGGEQIWTTAELKGMLKQAEQGYASNAKQIIFYGQTVLFHSKDEIRTAINDIRNEIKRRTRTDGKSGRVKRVSITTRSKGFQ